MKILPVTSLLVVLALARNSAAQSVSGFTVLPWNPTAGLAFSAQTAVTAAALTAAPAAPTSVTLVPQSNLQDVRISWVDRSSNEDGFEIQSEVKIGSRFTNTTTVGTTGANVTTFVDSPGLGTFRYRVRSFNSFGSSAWTKWATVRIR